MKGEGTFEHIDDRCRRYAALSDEERIAWIKADRWIGFDQAQAALVRLNALLAYPPRDRMPCLLIYGNTGMGKAQRSCANSSGRIRPHCVSPQGVINRPVVVAQVPSEPVERDLYRELLASLQAPALVGGTLAREKDICRSLLRTVGARMIVLDEVNGMLGRDLSAATDFPECAAVSGERPEPLVCAGTDLARQALLTDAQLAERFEAFHLKPWKNDHAFARGS